MGVCTAPPCSASRSVWVWPSPMCSRSSAPSSSFFLAALDRSFDEVADTFRHAASEYAAGRGPEGCEDTLEALGLSYRELLANDRDHLMLQHHSYAAACDDERVRARVRHRFAQMVEFARELSGAPAERLDAFFCAGMALNVAASLGVEDLSISCPWVRDELT